MLSTWKYINKKEILGIGFRVGVVWDINCLISILSVPALDVHQPASKSGNVQNSTHYTSSVTLH